MAYGEKTAARLLRGVTVFAVALCMSASASAQNWILPSKLPGTPVLCPPTICKNGAAWLAPYQQPMTTFVGRFLDSSAVGDSNRWPIATIRAAQVKSLPGSDRFYLHMNASVAMYKKTSFINRLASGEMLGAATGFPRAAGSRGPDGVERILWPDATFAAPFADSVWSIPMYDFTPQLGTFDIDDQGYIYLAYWQYGFDIIRDVDVDFTPISQTAPNFTPVFVITMKTSAGRYYALLSDSLSKNALYDVTDRTAPILQQAPGVGVFNDGSKNLAHNRIALVDSNGTVKIFTSDSLAIGGAPLNTFSATDGGKFQFVVSDGTNFYGVSRGPSAGTSITVFTPSGAAYSSSQRYELTVRSRGAVTTFNPSSANYSDGYLTIAGGFGTRDLRIFRVSGDAAPSEVDTSDYLRNAYADPPPASNGLTYTTAASAVNPGANQLTSGSMMRIAGKEYLLVNAKGLGDVYEMNVTGGPTSTALTSSANPSPAGQTVTFTATVTSTGSGTITGNVAFRDGTTLLGTVALNSGTAALSTSTLTAGTHSITATFESNGSFGTSSSTALDQVVNATFAAPAGLVATAITPVQVSVSWLPVSGATSYEVFRSTLHGNYALLTTTTSTAISDSVSPNTTFLYRVRAIGPAVSDFSAVDAATTVDFTDASLSTTQIKTVHIMQLRTAVNAMRAAAGLPAGSYTDASLAGMQVKAVHLMELRGALDAARAVIGLPPASYTDASLTAGVTAKSAHVTDLRAATQ